MGCIGKKKSLIFYLSKSSHIAAQKKIERKLTFLRNTTNVNRYQLLTTLAYVLDSSASTQTSVMVFSEHSKIQLSQLKAYKYTKIKSQVLENTFLFILPSVQLHAVVAQSHS